MHLVTTTALSLDPTLFLFLGSLSQDLLKSRGSGDANLRVALVLLTMGLALVGN